MPSPISSPSRLLVYGVCLLGGDMEEEILTYLPLVSAPLRGGKYSPPPRKRPYSLTPSMRGQRGCKEKVPVHPIILRLFLLFVAA